MNCLIIAATVDEIAPFLDHYRQHQHSFQHAIDVKITGIGLTATTYSLTKQIQLNRPALVIQAGIAGCFDATIQLGETVIVKQDTIADQLVVEKNNPATLFDLGLIKPNEFPFSKKWLVNKNELLKKISLKKVKAISVNEITTSKKRIAEYTRMYNPSIETMEGAALHYVCGSEKIPFLQLRSCSNYIGERNKKKWRLKESISNLNQELLILLEKL